MTPLIRTGLAVLCCSLAQAAPAQPPATADKKPEQKIATIRRLLGEVMIDTRAFQTEMPLSRFLQSLHVAQVVQMVQGRLAPGKGVAVRIDEEAFGKRAADVSQTPVKLPPFPKRMTLGTALRIALSKVGDRTEVDYRIWPTHVAITTPERALY